MEEYKIKVNQNIYQVKIIEITETQVKVEVNGKAHTMDIETLRNFTPVKK